VHDDVWAFAIEKRDRARLERDEQHARFGPDIYGPIPERE
jgi:hypothetical protein